MFKNILNKYFAILLIVEHPELRICACLGVCLVHQSEGVCLVQAQELEAVSLGRGLGGGEGEAGGQQQGHEASRHLKHGPLTLCDTAHPMVICRE